MCLIFLTRIDGVTKIWKVRGVSIRRRDRHQPRDFGNSVISDAKQREPVLAQMKKLLPD